MAQNFWKVTCDEKRYPGIWRKWFQEQCVAVGWASPSEPSTQVNNCLKSVHPGDQIVVQLVGGQFPHRVGRIGTVVEKRVRDDQWDETVAPSKRQPSGEHGRRILVRWDLTLGPEAYNEVVSLPPNARFPLYMLQQPIFELDRGLFIGIRKALIDRNNWGSMFSYFRNEGALSDHIAEFPYRLEPDLKQYPDAGKIREKALRDGKRLDVLLLDAKSNPVVVECKRGDAVPEHIDQLLGYISSIRKLTRKSLVRGMLVHGGARSLSRDVRRKLRGRRFIRVFQYSLNLDFSESK